MSECFYYLHTHVDLYKLFNSYMLEHGLAPHNIPAESTFNYVWRKENFPKQLGSKYNRLGDCPVCSVLINMRKRPNHSAGQLHAILERQNEHAKQHRFGIPTKEKKLTSFN